jgi:hypothetical protein
MHKLCSGRYGIVIDDLPGRLQALLGFSVFCGLKLCIEDAYRADSSCLENCEDDLVSLLLKAIDQRNYRLDDAIDLATSLVAKGIRGGRNLAGMEQILKSMWSLNSSSTTKALIGQPDGAYENLMCILLEALPRPTAMILNGNEPEYSEALRFQRDFIHMSPPTLAEALLKRGVDANQLNSGGCTPMDSVIKIVTRDSFLPAQYHHTLCSLFLRHGGVMSNYSPVQWGECIRKFPSAGFDIHGFGQAGFEQAEISRRN